MKAPSILVHKRMLEKTSGRLNCLTPFGMDRIPTGNHIRNILDPAPPEHFDDVLVKMVRNLETGGAPRSLHRNCFGLTETPSNLIALDGSKYSSSYAIGCPNCSTRMRNRGTDKQNCERNAVKCRRGRIAPRLARKHPVQLGDDLLDCQPICNAMFEVGPV
ncbi:MAG: hypothetical protein OXI01_22025 [Albidovulum sp.]|nr:hypothetical protein [Albidovulum sp.]